MPKNTISVEEIKQIAETAINARNAASTAKKAADDAGGTDEALNTAFSEAERVAKEAESKATALSHKQAPADDSAKKVNKLKRKREYINLELKELGADDEGDEDDGDDDDEIDDDRPVTHGDLRKMNQKAARESAVSMADAISDEADKAAVKAALAQVVHSGDPEKDFKAAVAIANIERNSKILEEIGRRGVVRRKPTGTGAAPLIEDAFEPTNMEKMYMRPPFSLSKQDILKTRG